MKTDSDSKVVLFADDNSIIITSPNQERLQTALNKRLSDQIYGLEPISYSLTLIKPYLQFRKKITLTRH
jgi:hypothetical protein